MNRLHHKGHTRQAGFHPTLTVIETPPAPTWHRTNLQTYELKLTFGELALIYKSLQSVKTRGELPPQDELLDDTLQLVDQALNRAA